MKKTIKPATVEEILTHPPLTPPAAAAQPKGNTARKGKIARLPKDIRDQLSLRLQDGSQAKPLVDWLNALPAVKAVLKAEFEGRLIREQNISEWRHGGYKDWCAQQQALEMMDRVTSDTAELQAGANGPLADKLAHWLLARHLVAAQAVTNDDGTVDPKRLRELTRDVVALRRGDVWAERARMERERFEYQKVKDARDQEKLFWEWAMIYENRERICKGFKTFQQKIEMFGQQYFGDELWNTDEEEAAAQQAIAREAIAMQESVEAAIAAYEAAQAAQEEGEEEEEEPVRVVKKSRKRRQAEADKHSSAKPQGPEQPQASTAHPTANPAQSDQLRPTPGKTGAANGKQPNAKLQTPKEIPTAKLQTPNNLQIPKHPNTQGGGNATAAGQNSELGTSHPEPTGQSESIRPNPGSHNGKFQNSKPKFKTNHDEQPPKDPGAPPNP